KNSYRDDNKELGEEGTQEVRQDEERKMEGGTGSDGHSQTEEGTQVPLSGEKETTRVWRCQGPGMVVPERSPSWGFFSSLAPRSCWRMDAHAIARRENSVEIGYDSIAFEIVLDLASQRQQRYEDALEKRTQDRLERGDWGNEDPSHDVDINGRPGTANASSTGNQPNFTTRLVITHVLPFRLLGPGAGGLPVRELGPLLFDDAPDGPDGKLLSGLWVPEEDGVEDGVWKRITNLPGLERGRSAAGAEARAGASTRAEKTKTGDPAEA
ncbi:unnamed protein product, partial [Discosporangium mesarthrocarpum]